MVNIGKFNNLRIVKKVDFGLYLDGGEFGELLLPTRYVPANVEIDSFIDVFIYSDSEDRLIATTEKPLAQVDEFALLKVVSVGTIGAFLSWGLTKDLLVPYREQNQKMEVGRQYIVRVYLDEKTNRPVASAKIDKFLNQIPIDVYEGEQVDLMICNQTDLGYKVIINNVFGGVLYQNEIFKNITRGDRIKGYIKKIREDKKIDVCLDKPGFEKVDELTDLIIQKLTQNGGFMPLTDKTSPEKISDIFGVSKKTFKKAIGALYKSRKIEILDSGIKLENKT